jgi:hypothetical protein
MAAVAYDVDGRTNARVFVAVYGGATKGEAQRVWVKARRNYRSAAIKRMRVVWSQIVQ